MPKQLDENLAFRKNIMELGYGNRAFAEELWIMCSRDILFYINAFVWTYNPRNPEGQKVVPFITYEFQDTAILELIMCIEDGVDVLIEKSRDMGASWICIIIEDFLISFRQMYSFLMVSRNQDLVDKTEDPDCLFWKNDFITKNLPGFLKPNLTRNKLHIQNHQTGGTIDGSSTTGDASRGGRRTSIFFDEFASVEDGYAVLAASADATNCRIFNSTPKGAGNAFYDLKMSGIKTLRFHWSEHPDKAAGLYSSDSKGELAILDNNYKYPEGFKFILDGKLRSPWYDRECKRRKFAQEIAQELDIDYLGSGYQYFDNVTIEKAQEFVVAPYQVGEFDIEEYTFNVTRFVDQPKGRFDLWVMLEGGQKPLAGRYGVACDIATGTGASNSVLGVGDMVTKEKILEFTDPNISPHNFAKLAVAVARFFYNAYMIWEANGPGRNFGDQVIEAGYRNIYYKTNDKSLSKKESDFPGFYTTKDSKIALLGDYRNALASSEYLNRSLKSLQECRYYIYNNGTIEHSTSIKAMDPSGARDNHGDRVIMDALLWKIMSSSRHTSAPAIEVPEGSLMERRNLASDRARRNGGEW